jgi:hypothetical protein
LVIPQLIPDGPEGKLGDFRFAQWPAHVVAAQFLVTFIDRSVPSTRVIRIAEVRRDVWDALFPPDLLVRAPGGERLSGVFGSYNAARVHEHLRDLHTEAGRSQLSASATGADADIASLVASVTQAQLSATDDRLRLALELLGPELHEREEIARRLTRLAQAAESSTRESGTEHFVPIVPDDGTLQSAYAQFASFHMQAALGPPRSSGAPIKAKSPQVDFHQSLTLLAEYPDLLRLLGLVVDLELPADHLVPRSPEQSFVGTIAQLPGGAEIPRRAIPDTRYTTDHRSLFAAAPRGKELLSGLLNLRQRDAETRELIFSIAGFDVDGAGLQLINVLRTPADRRMRGENAVPALRTTGLTLLRAQRAKAFHGAYRELDESLNHPQPGTRAVFFAEDLVRGYRVDVREVRTGKWQSLHLRQGDYTLNATGAKVKLDDEGVVIPAVAQPDRSADNVAAAAYDESQPNFLPETIFVWDGYSLSAPRPGKLMPDQSPRPTGVEPSLPLEARFTPVPGSLPRLRFGGDYQMRLRAADPAGNGLNIPEADKAILAIAQTQEPPALPLEQAWRHVRCEPVAAPILTRTDGVDKDCINPVVLRGEADVPSAPDTAAERLITPPLISWPMAEQHGMFDASMGTRQHHELTFALASGESPAGDTRVHANVGAPGDLPDPVAAGVAIQNCPGVPPGQVGRFEGQTLRLEPLNVPESIGAHVQSLLLVDFAAAPEWPRIDGILLRLKEGSGPPQWDNQRRVLSLFLPKAVEQDVRTACHLKQEFLDHLSLIHWIQQRLEHEEKDGQITAQQKAAELSALLRAVRLGLLPTVTPARRVQLVHAVRQPLEGGPSLTHFDPPARMMSGTEAFLGGTVSYEKSSTGAIELHASWQELVDDPNAPRAGHVPHRARPLSVALETDPDNLPSGIVVDREQGRVEVRLLPVAGAEAEVSAGLANVHLMMQRLRSIPHPMSISGLESEERELLAAARQPLHASFAEIAAVAGVMAEMAGTAADPPWNLPHHPPEISMALRHAFRDLEKAAEDLAKQAEDGASELRSPPYPFQEFGDPRHRQVTYRVGAVSRFAGLYPRPRDRDEKADQFTRDGDSTTVSIPASARPAPPKLDYILPTFTWARTMWPRGRRGNERISGLRLYLQRPWYSSGEGELLAVLLGSGQSAWVQDPIWFSPSLSLPDLTVEHFNGHATVLTGLQSPNPSGSPITAIGYTIDYNAEGQCFCDVGVQAETAYFPFLRLAIARLQPSSLKGLELSEIVLAPSVQLPPHRTVMVTREGDAQLSIEISGVTHSAPADPANPTGVTGTNFRAGFQRRLPGSLDEAGWQTAQEVGSVTVEPSVAPVLWKATVAFAGAGGDCRLLLEELEVYTRLNSAAATGLERSERVVFVETVPLSTAATQAGPVAPNTTLYAIASNLDLLWYSHTGRESAAYEWSAPAGQRVGNGWSVRHIFPGFDGAIYAIDANGNLKWYRHTGRLTGEYRWATGSGSRIGTGWSFPKVFGGGNGIIYAVDTNGNLLWTNHAGYRDGKATWATAAPKKVGEGWGQFIHLFAADGGVIYAVTPEYDLLWYRHAGNGNGGPTWASPMGRKIGNGWNFRHVFAAGGGVIYAIKENGDLLWYKHDGYADGSFRWDPRGGSQIGNGWNFTFVFSGTSLTP